jgi:hypothetical protein
MNPGPGIKKYNKLFKEYIINTKIPTSEGWEDEIKVYPKGDRFIFEYKDTTGVVHWIDM